MIVLTFVASSPMNFDNDDLSPDGIDRTIRMNIGHKDISPPDPVEDYFNICDLGRFSGGSVDFVGVFIDTSGSMDRGTVEASLAQFEAAIAAAGLTISQVFNSREDWISPFLTSLAPTTTARSEIASTMTIRADEEIIGACEHCKQVCARDFSCQEDTQCKEACIEIDNVRF